MIVPSSDYSPTHSPPAIIRSYQSGESPVSDDFLHRRNLPEKKSNMGLSYTAQLFSKKDEFSSRLYSFYLCSEDAIARYKRVYNTNNYNTDPINPFLDAVKQIVCDSGYIPRFSFYSDGAKAVFNIRQQKIEIEYDFNEPEFVFVSKDIDDVLHIKDTTLDNLKQTLVAFL